MMKGGRGGTANVGVNDTRRRWELFGRPQPGAKRRTFEEQIAREMAGTPQGVGSTAVYQRLAVSISGPSNALGDHDEVEKDGQSGAGSVEKHVLDTMLAGQPNASVEILTSIIDRTVRDKRILLFMPGSSRNVHEMPTDGMITSRGRHCARPRRVPNERSGKTVRRASRQLSAAADVLEGMAADGRQLPGLTVTIKASRRLPHLVGREFVVMGAYRSRNCVLLFDRKRGKTVRCQVNDIQACEIPRFRTILPLSEVVKHTIC